MHTTESRVIPRNQRYESIQAEIERHFRSHQFCYMDFAAAEVIHVVSVGMSGWVAVIGNGDQGDYEWVSRDDGQRVRYSHSNLGYGCCASALRDGLIAAL